MIRPFNFSLPEVELSDLKYRISQTRWPDEISDSRWKYGANLSYIKELAQYWQHHFDWRTIEERIFSYPNFIAELDGFKIHFLHIKGNGKKSIPIVITHGWPGSFLELFKLIPLLTVNPALSFDVVIPSVLGFGFSQKITNPGCNLWLMGALWNKLMRELGYSKFIAQGGDFGAGISTAIALQHPESMLGLHLNYIPGSYLPYLDADEKLTEEERWFQKTSNDWYNREGAYAHQHRTKPITLAYGLNDSPVGLCAWIVEKFQAWSDCSADVERVFTKDELLANVSLYWFTETIHSSIRLYNENSQAPLHFKKGDFIKVPVGIARFSKEEPFPPRQYIERGYNVQHWTDFPKGGHFAAMEHPDLLATDILSFTHKCVSVNNNVD